MPAPDVTTLPSPPLRTDEPAVFNSKAEAFVAALVAFVPELNALADYLESLESGTLSALLAAIDAAGSSANKLAYYTGTNGVALTDFTSLARTILARTSGAQIRSDIGAGTGNGDLLASNNLSDVANAATAFANILQAAVSSDLNTGTNTSKAVTADALAGSNFGIKTIEVLLSDPGGSAITTGDGKAYVRITSDLNGMNLVACGAVLDTAGTGGGYLMQLRRKRSGSDVDMLSTRISIDSGGNDSADAGTPPAINASNDDVATGDRIYFDRDGVPTGGKGDTVWMQFQLP